AEFTGIYFHGDRLSNMPYLFARLIALGLILGGLLGVLIALFRTVVGSKRQLRVSRMHSAAPVGALEQKSVAQSLGQKVL
ncbi:hypothetical protein, partial [Pseudomonas lactis]|uniref:hypothetical protein n=1 Tax=Pseudomonas lactis TaxID=1615674 RepID=UPI003F8027BC